MSDENKTGPVAAQKSAQELLIETQLEAAQLAKSNALLDQQLKREALDDLQSQREERSYNIEERRLANADRATKAEQLKQTRAAIGRTVAQQEATDKLRFSACTHKKGGIVKPRDMRVLSTGGNSPQYAVFKHQMINGDVWIRCSRCGKTWSPPIRERFYFERLGQTDKKSGRYMNLSREVAPKDGVFDEELFKLANNEYWDAVKFETNNTMSSSVQCRFTKYDPATGEWSTDAAKDYAESVAYSTLR